MQAWASALCRLAHQQLYSGLWVQASIFWFSWVPQLNTDPHRTKIQTSPLTISSVALINKTEPTVAYLYLKTSCTAVFGLFTIMNRWLAKVQQWRGQPWLMSISHHLVMMREERSGFIPVFGETDGHYYYVSEDEEANSTISVYLFINRSLKFAGILFVQG